MMSLEIEGHAEKRQAEEIIASTPKMPGIDSVSVGLGSDWSGDPSLNLTFLLQHDCVIDDDFARRFVDYSASVVDKILQSGVSRFPYTRVKRAA